MAPTNTPNEGDKVTRSTRSCNKKKTIVESATDEEFATEHIYDYSNKATRNIKPLEEKKKKTSNQHYINPK